MNSIAKNRSRELLFALIVALVLPMIVRAEEPNDNIVWEQVLREQYFTGQTIAEDKSIIDLVTPYRAEDAALMPLSVNAKIPQTTQRYIEKLYLFVDKNPQPLVGIFSFSPLLGKADLATRVRINQYTNVRAIAVLNNGEHHMTTNYVKAQGGCSAPLAADLQAAMQRLGQMKLRVLNTPKTGEQLLVNFMVSHPNITGMQLDQRTRLITPEHYVKRILLSYDNAPLLTADVGFSLSSDPSLRFFIPSNLRGKLNAEVRDSKGQQFTAAYELSKLEH
jgi:sulfur-oxidizing protein SoxY